MTQRSRSASSWRAAAWLMAAVLARGTTVLEGLSELKHKESDRLRRGHHPPRRALQ